MKEMADLQKKLADEAERAAKARTDATRVANSITQTMTTVSASLNRSGSSTPAA